ncbi:MAG: hypothetical protein RL531_1775 [Actinomycetota bacterium]
MTRREPERYAGAMEPPHTPSRRRRNVILLVAGGVLVVGIGLFAWFRPDRAVIDQRVDDALPSEVVDALAGSGDDAPRPDGPTGTGDAVEEPAPERAVIGAGTFVGQAGHSVAGRAVVLDTDDGRVLVLEDLDSENGPDLQLYLSPSAAGSVDGGRRIEALRGNQGTQLYRLPADLDLAELPHVVIWCDRFSTPFGTATLRA